TASGKTLCYNLPVLNHLLQEPQARALYLFPTKALAQDQREELLGLIRGTGATLSAEVYDGDTPASARRRIRASANIVITNPDMLHLGILPHHTQWLQLWTTLRYIVIDEVHQYRGLFGSHFANLLRRLRRIARFYGCEPQIISASATIANPGDLVERLIDAERPVTVIDESGAPQGEKHFIFWNPPPFNEQLGLRRSALLEARRVAALFLQEAVQSIVFTRSRLATEVLLRYLQEEGTRMGMTEGMIRGYRGGYLPLERREIEQGLREGKVRGVVSTNALELGIDIGQLEASLMLGYPGTIASTWQQAGRAGRRAGTSVAVLLASSDPLDQFIIGHPEWFFNASPEYARINPDNLLILLNHLKCATFELPFAPEEGFGSLPPEALREILAFLEEEGVIHCAADTYYWTAESYPAERVSLRMVTNDGMLITMQPGGLVIGEVDRFAVHQMCFPGAIYMHEGRQFLIEALEWEESRALARPVEVDYYTRSQSKRSVAVVETLASDGAHQWGDLLVTSVTTGFKKIKLHTHENLGTFDLVLPEAQMHTTGYWLTFPVEVASERRDYGPNWAQQRLRARGREDFRCAHCRISEDELGREVDVHHLIPFRDFGYVAGKNDGYLAANDLSNLVCLCPSCHKRAEPWYRSEVAAGLAGVANALGNIAPLFLMCDARDLGSSSELRPAESDGPTIFLYDMVPSGVGFAEQLFALHHELLRATVALIRDCPCAQGCPACVGPEAMAGDGGKKHSLALLELLAG
ncbi:MAG: DUF1998 domain-containing protein, partial [Ardenticatenales bacterium]|nr:DUF1998 domain-containing protein [Ardenticatenales bacterium]